MISLFKFYALPYLIETILWLSTIDFFRGLFKGVLALNATYFGYSVCYDFGVSIIDFDYFYCLI